MAVVTLDRLTKIYDRHHAPAADAVSLDIRHGEFMVPLGPSGCGKTTTLRMIAGLESITLNRVDRRPHRNAVPAKERDMRWCSSPTRLPAHEREGKPGGRPAAARRAARRDRAPRQRVATTLGPRPCSTVSRMRCPADSASAWRSGAPSCASKVFLTTSRRQSRCGAARVDAARSGAASKARRHDDLCHARPGRGDDHGRASAS